MTKLRIGLLLDSRDITAWVHAMLERIVDSDYASIELIVVDAHERASRSLVSRFRNNWTNIPTAVVRRTLDGLYRILMRDPTRKPDAFVRGDCAALLADVPVLDVIPKQTKFSDYISDADIATIEAYDIDVFIRLGFRILRGRILDVPRYGVWSFHHGDNRVNRGGPAGYWEFADAAPTTGSVLQVLSEDLDNGSVLYRSWSRTSDRSVEDNKRNNYWKTLSFIPRQLETLARLGPDRFFERVGKENTHPEFYDNRLYVAPTNRERFRLIRRLINRKIKNRLTNTLFFDQWTLMFQIQPQMSTSFWRFKSITPPKDRFWADPHVIYRDGLYYVFLEEYMYATRRGHIAVMTIDETGRHTTPVPVLERPYHLSYPYVFEADGTLYMVPETGNHRTIELYRCTRFPDQWTWEMNLMENVHAVDATLHHANGTWWLFANMSETPGASTCDELHLFHADALLTTTWTPHPLNPIVSDVRRARPAGRLFELQGRLYRPSQNCTPRYGYGINLNEIEVLNEEDYREVLRTSAKPHWDNSLQAMHTFSLAHHMTMIDVQRRRPRLGR